MPSLANEPLNAEPSQPEQREQLELPPKSYADAVEEEPPVNGSSNENASNGIQNKSPHANGDKGGSSSGLPKNAASVLRIVDTGAPEKKDSPDTRPQVGRRESKQEYSATVGVAVEQAQIKAPY